MYGASIRERLTRPVHLANEVIRRIDDRLFAPRVRDTQAPIFIVGAPRSGTTLTYQVLVQGLGTTFVPRLLDYGYGLSNLTFRLLQRQLTNPPPVFQSEYGRTPGLLSPSEGFGYWKRWFGRAPDADHYFGSPLKPSDEEDLRWHVQSLQGHYHSPLLVKCLYLSLSIPALHHAFPNARFIFVRRNKNATAASILKARRAVNPAGWWSIRPPGYRDHLHETWLDQTVWQLGQTLRIVTRQLGQLPSENWTALDFEDLCHDPTGAVTRLRDLLAPTIETSKNLAVLPPHFHLPASPSKTDLRELRKSRYFASLADLTI